MGSKKEVSFICTLVFAAIFVVSMAFLTIRSTFAYPEEINSAVWSVYNGKTEVKNKNLGKVNISINNYDVSVRLKKYGEEFSFINEVVNDGGYNAVLSKLEITDLSKFRVGTSSKTNKTYTLEDYVLVRVDYAVNNEKNDVKKDRKVAVGDKLKMGTTNKVIVSVKLRDKNKLTEDQIEVFEKYGEMVNLDINVSTLYQQY